MTPAETAFRIAYTLAGGRIPTRTAQGVYVAFPQKGEAKPGVQGIRWLSSELAAMAHITLSSTVLSEIAGDALGALLDEDAELAAEVRRPKVP